MVFELPSCIESLVSSAVQLQNLAHELGQYYIKNLIIYSCSCNDAESPTIASYSTTNGSPDKKNQSLDLERISKDLKCLNSLNSTIEMLPFLEGLNQNVEKCFVTIEVTFKRLVYHLNKSQKNPNDMRDGDDFQLNSDARLHFIFISIMDLVYALISLDKTIVHHTNLCNSLDLFKSVCKLVVSRTQSQPGEAMNGIDTLPKDELKGLIDYIDNIQLTLCNRSDLFQQFLQHIQHLNYTLSGDKTLKGYRLLQEHFEEFIVFYGENILQDSHNSTVDCSLSSSTMGLINRLVIPLGYIQREPPNVPLKLLGLSTIFVIYLNIFKNHDRKVLRSFSSSLMKVKQFTLVHAIGSNSFIQLEEFLLKFCDKILDLKVPLRYYQEKNELIFKSNISTEYEKFALKVASWLLRFKTMKQQANNINGNVDAQKLCPRKLLELAQEGRSIVSELNYFIKCTITSYSKLNKPMPKDKLIYLFRLITFEKSITRSSKRSATLLERAVNQLENLARQKVSRLIGSACQRLLTMKYSEKKLNTDSILLLQTICLDVEDFGHNGWSKRDMLTLAFGLSMLLPSLNTNELTALNELLVDSNHAGLVDSLDACSDCSYLHWSISSFSTYYSNAFEENPCAFNELKYFHLAVNDIFSLFYFESPFQGIRSYSFYSSWLQEKCDKLVVKLENELIEQFKVDFLDKICQEFEMELRLQTHRDLHLNGHNPFKRHLYNFKHIFSEEANMNFYICSQRLSMKLYIEDYLNRICYNLTAISPNDWFTYDTMINLARHKYNLTFVKSQLPTQTLDHGLDLLDITRNLALFSSRYGYDLTNQLFIEKSSNRLSTSAGSSASSIFTLSNTLLNGQQQYYSNFTPNLNVLQISQVAKSIQTHGYGVLNSSVNCTYQVMKRLINLFAKQISSDEKLRAILIKEHQQLSALKQQNNHQYHLIMNFEKANRLAKKFKFSSSTSFQSNISKQQPETALTRQSSFGSLPGSKFDFDSLRQLITQLGNLLGFVRMLKSGALHCASKSVDYLPDLDNLSMLKLEQSVRNEFQSFENESLIEAAKNFDLCLEDFEKNFSTKTNYFSILVEIFSKILTPATNHSSSTTNDQDSESSPKDEIQNGDVDSEISSTETTAKPYQRATVDGKDQMLKLFFLMIPALTINFIDYIINCKDRLTSRSSQARFGALISDDGFTMGIAFLLIILKQTDQFAQLDWFGQVKAKLQQDLDGVKRRIEDSQYEESLKQTSNMTMRRLTRLLIEYDSLNYTLSSASMFFRSSTTIARAN